MVEWAATAGNCRYGGGGGADDGTNGEDRCVASQRRSMWPHRVTGGFSMGLGILLEMWAIALCLNGELDCLGVVLFFGPLLFVAGWKMWHGTFGTFPARRG